MSPLNGTHSLHLLKEEVATLVELYSEPALSLGEFPARAMLEREEARHTTLSRNVALKKKRSGFIISGGQVEKV